jgi:hypothetical protein
VEENSLTVVEGIVAGIGEGAVKANAVLETELFEEFGADLVAALADLKRENFTHVLRGLEGERNGFAQLDCVSKLNFN